MILKVMLLNLNNYGHYIHNKIMVYASNKIIYLNLLVN